MKIVIACDHRGFEAKRRLLPLLARAEHQVVDLGCDSTAACDYPDFAIPVARAIERGEADVGILLDGSGIGMTITANKVCGVRAGLVHDEVTARRAREHHHCNVLCLGTDLLSEEQLRTIVTAFLDSPLGSGRHERRLHKIRELEEEIHAARAAGDERAPVAPEIAVAAESIPTARGSRR